MLELPIITHKMKNRRRNSTKKVVWWKSKIFISLVLSFALAYGILCLKMLNAPITPIPAESTAIVTDNYTWPENLDLNGKHEYLLSALGVPKSPPTPTRQDHAKTTSSKNNNGFKTAASGKASSNTSKAKPASKGKALPMKPAISQKAVLLTRDSYVIASVTGNRGPPDILTSAKCDDPEQDSWQAALNDSGSPIPGPHFVLFVLQQPAQQVTRVVLDYTEAYSDSYKVEVLCKQTGVWRELHNNIVKSRTANNILKVALSPGHVVHTIDVMDGFAVKKNQKSVVASNLCPIAALRIGIKKPSTAKGTALWRVEAWGYNLHRRISG